MGNYELTWSGLSTLLEKDLLNQATRLVLLIYRSTLNAWHNNLINLVLYTMDS